MDSSQLLKGVLDLAVLAVLNDRDGYGYDVVRRLREAGLQEVGDASVYGTLRRLFKAGALTSYVPSRPPWRPCSRRDDHDPRTGRTGCSVRIIPSVRSCWRTSTIT
ncbi:PadR family transcriptional regulator [Nonomuraea sp. PA05]|uniref:PadR family transcriptional regulator n=1 Tax=Nonomuraea sp. PA05 TaxID=2604466 RepID=UPI0021CD1121|nr:PadR family transcriptional regulator [Nonomuraea sp. PA05]